MLDLSTEQLPANYRGNDPENAYSLLTPPGKDEFETTEAYATRVQSRGSRLYCFLSDPRLVFAKYDADTETLAVTVAGDPGIHEHYHDDYRRFAFVLRRDELGRREYIATNAFGATISVDSSSYKFFALIPTNQPLNFADGRLSGFMYKTDLPVSAERARAAKDSLGALLICETDPAVSAATSTGFHQAKATFESPTEVITKYVYLRLPLSQIWLFNRRTGEILRKDAIRRD